MRFDAEQRFKIPHDQLLAMFTDPDFYSSLGGLPQISVPEVVRHSVSGDTVCIDLHQRYTGDLPAAALTVIDPAKLTWIEELVFDLEAETATSRLVPDHYADRLSCTGTYSFRSDGASGSIRRLDGDLRVRVPLVGGRVEQALVSGLRQHAEAEEYLVGHRLTATDESSGSPTAKKAKSKSKTKSKAKPKKHDKPKSGGRSKGSTKG